jgi:hypothetical protein
MKGILLSQSFRYNDLKLDVSGAVINCQSITVENGKVSHSDYTNVKVDDKHFSFQLKRTEEGVPTADIWNISVGVDSQSIINEFMQFVENDIILKEDNITQ